MTKPTRVSSRSPVPSHAGANRASLTTRSPSVRETGTNNKGLTAVYATVRAIRNLILRRELLPGEQLRQMDLAQRLQVSRIPVREALSVLIAEHLVTYHPQRGFFVSKLDAEEFRQLRKMRSLLEASALGELNWPDSEALAALEQLNERITRAALQGHMDDMRERNCEFHSRILGFSRLHLIVAEIERLRVFADLYRWLYVWDEESCERSHREHCAMIDALRRRDASALIALRELHTGKFEESVASRLPSPRSNQSVSSDTGTG
jgi:DNA-binding GntR family transcriptional regulator